MTTLSPPPPTASLVAFRTALPVSEDASLTADRLCALGVSMRLAKGEQLAPDPEEDLLVHITSGAAKLVMVHAVPIGCQVLAFHLPGDLVSLLRQGTSLCADNCRLIALSECQAVVFPADRFLDIAQGDPVVLRSVLTRSLEALHRSRTRMMQMGHKSARQRIADFLVVMAERLTGCTEGACTFILPMSRRDIGDSLGLTIETVSRQLTELRDAGLVATEGRSGVRVADVCALAHIAGRHGSRKY